jgi:hypothetical protein
MPPPCSWPGCRRMWSAVGSGHADVQTGLGRALSRRPSAAGAGFTIAEDMQEAFSSFSPARGPRLRRRGPDQARCLGADITGALANANPSAGSPPPPSFHQGDARMADDLSICSSGERQHRQPDSAKPYAMIKG